RVASPLIDRNTELAAAERFLGSLKDGPAALVIEGEAGIGKSSLLDAVVDVAARAGAMLLTARAAAAEADLGLAGLTDLLTDVPDELLRRLPDLQRRAIDAARLRGEGGSGPGGPADGRALGMAVWTILTDLAADATLIVAIDDLQWLDPGTARVLDFAL